MSGADDERVLSMHPNFDILSRPCPECGDKLIRNREGIECGAGHCSYRERPDDLVAECASLRLVQMRVERDRLRAALERIQEGSECDHINLLCRGDHDQYVCPTIVARVALDAKAGGSAPEGDGLTSNAERERFETCFSRWLLVPGSMCWERDVLRYCRQQLWDVWQRKANGEEIT